MQDEEKWKLRIMEATNVGVLLLCDGLEELAFARMLWETEELSE